MGRRVVVLLVSGCSLIGACGSTPTTPADAPTIDAPADAAIDAFDPGPATVFVVACGTESASVESTGGFRFAPQSVTITVGENVEFTNPTSHSVVPVFPNSDDGLRVGFGTTSCLQFTVAGTFNYRCNPHSSMTGTVTVN